MSAIEENAIINVYTNSIFIRYHLIIMMRVMHEKNVKSERKYTYKSAIISHLILQRKEKNQNDISSMCFFAKRLSSALQHQTADAFRKLNDCTICD